MSIPVDNLYDYLESLIKEPIVSYLFRPYGSRKLSDLHLLHDYVGNNLFAPAVVFNDQEPLNFDYYTRYTDSVINDIELCNPEHFFKILNQSYFNTISSNIQQTFQKRLAYHYGISVWNKHILVHSEKGSSDLQKYEANGFIGVHFWSHAIIAQDWYRFAQHDARLNYTNKNNRKFLIYCRDWSGSREYRLKFLELLTSEVQLKDCAVALNKSIDNITPFEHQFKNPKFEYRNPDFINSLPNNHVDSTASADYDYKDFIGSDISVVLETLFDTNGVHLTEKTLRPIACKHPFIVAAGSGSLEYIKSYGFKTFSKWINESYDLEKDPLKRLEKVVASIKELACLDSTTYARYIMEMKEVTEFNHAHFFSKEFTDQVLNEFTSNMRSALAKLKSESTGHEYLNVRELYKANGYQYKLDSPVGQAKMQLALQLQSR